MEKEHCTALLYKKSKNCYIEIFLPFYYLLSQYHLLVFGLGTIGLFVVALLSVASEKSFRWNKHYNIYAVFLIYILIKDIIDVFISGGGEQAQINRVAEYLVVFSLIFIVCSKGFDEEKLYKTWKAAGVVYTLGLLYHMLLIYVLGWYSVRPISLVPGYSLREIAYRPTSFFSEPAAFVTAMLPLEFLALRRKDIKWGIFSTLAILSSTSTTGIVLSMILWCYTFMRGKLRRSYKYIMYFAAVIIVLLFFNLSVFQGALNKVVDILHGGGTLNSRVIGAFELLKAMEWKQWIFGVSNVDVFEFVAQNLEKFSGVSIVLNRYLNKSLFLNALSNVVLNYGIFGLLLLLGTYLGKLRMKGYRAKGLILVCMAAMIGQSIFLNSYYYQMTILILLYCTKQSTEKLTGRNYQ